jgi:hypothetical protein
MDTGHHVLLERPRPRHIGPNRAPLRAPRARKARESVAPAPSVRRLRGPAWGWLYALFPLAALLCAFAEYLPMSPGWRRLTEGLVGLMIVGLAGIWVRANRCALSRLVPGAGTENEPQDVAVEIQKASPQVIPLGPQRRRSVS